MGESRGGGEDGELMEERVAGICHCHVPLASRVLVSSSLNVPEEAHFLEFLGPTLFSGRPSGHRTRQPLNGLVRR